MAIHQCGGGVKLSATEKQFKLTLMAVADLGEGPGGAGGPPLFWVEKEDMTEERKAVWARKVKPLRPPPPSLAQSLDPPLNGQ